MRALLVLTCLLLGAGGAAAQQPADRGSTTASSRMIDDFEGYEAGQIPDRWEWIDGKQIVPFADQWNSEQRSFVVLEEDGNRFVRATVTDFWHRIVLVNDDEPLWSLAESPCLTWDWRAIHLPIGAREDKVNDTGAAVYIYFQKDWLGRPRSLKYTYSSFLPVGYEKSFGPLKLEVVSTEADGTGEWVTIQQNVLEDYRDRFGKEPPDVPTLIALWGDTDSTKDTSIADFDNIRIGECR